MSLSFVSWNILIADAAVVAEVVQSPPSYTGYGMGAVAVATAIITAFREYQSSKAPSLQIQLDLARALIEDNRKAIADDRKAAEDARALAALLDAANGDLAKKYLAVKTENVELAAQVLVLRGVLAPAAACAHAEGESPR